MILRVKFDDVRILDFFKCLESSYSKYKTKLSLEVTTLGCICSPLWNGIKLNIVPN